MTDAEKTAIEKLAEKVGEVVTGLAVLEATTKQGFANVKVICDERHGATKDAIGELKPDTRAARDFSSRLSGAWKAATVVGAAALVVLGAVLGRYL